MASEGFHESSQDLKPQTRDMHRAIVSLMEELEAIDWYQQRVDAAGDDALRTILAHNRDEEKEHAVMVLEWIRRHDPVGFEYAEHVRFHIHLYAHCGGCLFGVRSCFLLVRLIRYIIRRF